MTPERPRNPHTARWLGFFFLALYLLTMGGHSSSPDEESLLLVARSLVERGRLDVPEAWADTSASLVVAADGRRYVPYGVLPSVLMVPFVVAGKAAAAELPARYHEWVVRLVANLLDPIVTAATCGLLFLCAQDLGFTATTSRSLALALGGATIAWPYSKWLWSEPVTGVALLAGATCLFRSLRRPGVAWPFLSGLAVAAALATKLTAAVVLPGFVACLAYPPRREALRRVAVFVSPLVLGLLGIAVWNRFRFGNALETGYQSLGAGLSAFDFTQARGMAGLLVSPGKSLLLYSPPLLLGVAAFPRFARRRRREAHLIVWIVLSHVVLYGAFLRWHGDSCWGPRYLVPVTALILLPAGSILEGGAGSGPRLWRWAFGLACALGILVQLGGVLTNYAAYTVRTGASFGPLSERRRWDPRLTPLVGHWRLLAARLAAWRAAPVHEVVLEDGFHAPEGPPGSLFPRWTRAEALLRVGDRHVRQVRLVVAYADARPPALGRAPIEVLVDGKPAARVLHFDPDRRAGEITLTVDRPPPAWRGLRVALRTTTWIPERDAGLPDRRDLGIFVRRLAIEGDGRALTVGEPWVARLPISEAKPWGKEAMAWFYDPAEHVVDLWPWYVYWSGLPRRVLLLALLPAALLVLAAWKLRVGVGSARR